MTQKDKQLKLWEAMLQGDLTALEQLYTLFHTDLYHYALKLTEHIDLAEDAVQDVFIDLWNYRKQLPIVNAPKFYLIRSVRNQSLKLIKKQNRLTTLEGVIPSKMIIRPEELQLKDHSELNKKALFDAMTALSPRQREIIYLKFYNNLDYEELADVLDINYQSVVNHIHKAMIKLRKADVLKHLKY